jgi:hypothetical protein
VDYATPRKSRANATTEHLRAELLISQTARWSGCVFLALEVGGQLPGFFAYPAALGDIEVGLTACVAPPPQTNRRMGLVHHRKRIP